ncbi:hypothetical protein PUNSTDRAFT_133363 [Punctularia strigosozonata HHB-11173 SS5]|uniref:uncharacterized protein n=1 Tax=Punctularia strigosozonata (strain HHB-11173) TaxID=741275 RepID=UPI0004417F3E|nr:uncharacterized protein PUNSTDRAFT_133363 [Punctularia strigosozonata HHB-11173 SS5]EIN09577.1 hypothetical protein PUNSTDRAFT_133363 [Punctularia strigosozonata HHB-11173 SS5]
MSSTASSPSLSPTRGAHRRLSARRGSVSAIDPWGKYKEINLNPGRSSSSKLTIVRVQEHPDEGTAAIGVNKRHSFGHSHKRPGNHGAGPGDSPRLSFANQSFVRPSSPTTPTSPGFNRPGSPTTARPGSPTTSRPRSPGPTGHRSLSHRKLTPEEIYELAKQSTNPQYAPKTASSSIPNTPVAASASLAPASFTPLTDDILLPFIDRSSEVTALISVPPSARLFGLLAQTLPKDGTNAGDPPSVSGDPRKWSYSQLDFWMKHVDRDRADDYTWVRKARACVLVHSELIWERIKGALGVPPELDMDEDAEWEYGGEAPAESPAEGGQAQVFQLDVDSSTPKGEESAAVPKLEIEGPSPAQEIDDPGLSSGASDNLSADEREITIEPVLVPTTPPLVVSDTATGLGGITEADEEEEEAADGATPPTEPPKEAIQGLRICTAPEGPQFSPLMASSYSPIPFGHSPTASFSSANIGSPSPLRLDGPAQEPAGPSPSSADEKQLVYKPRGRSYSSSSSSSFFSRDGYYDAVSERGPGNPLFPSSFAKLALGPTLKANMRSPVPPPPSIFSDPHAIRSAHRKLPSWAKGWDPVKHEYALTAASGSSIGYD